MDRLLGHRHLSRPLQRWAAIEVQTTCSISDFMPQVIKECKRHHSALSNRSGV